MTANTPQTSAITNKVNLLGMTVENLRIFFADLGEKPFRAQQIMQWIHQKGVTNFDEMTNVSKSLREKLAVVAEVRGPKILSFQESRDGTRKWLVEIEGGSIVESVLITDKGRATLCVSSQAGCSVDCSFCMTGKQGFQRDLTSAEIIGQVWEAIKAGDGFNTSGDRVVTNVVMMGMGEPLLNFDNVVDAMNIMMSDYAYGLSKRRVTVSTSGVVPSIDKLADKTDVSLALSLHAPNDALRSTLVPLNKKYPIKEVLDSCLRYMAKMPDIHRVTTIEYTLIKNVNDSVELARELAILLKDFPCKINLIPFNPFPGSDYERPDAASVKRFQDHLIRKGFIAPIRTTRGDDINAACGQLAGQVVDKTRRSARYKEQYLNADTKIPMQLIT